MRKLWAGTVVVAVTWTLFASAGYCGKYKYTGGAVANGGTISGVVQYDGPPKDIDIYLMKEKNGDFCSRHPDAKDGIRIDHKISSTNGLLQNAVVFIEDIEAGKEWGSGSTTADGGPSGFTRFHFRDCDISPKVTVIRKTRKGEKQGNLTVTTHDKGVLHNPIGYRVHGANRKVLFNKPLSSERNFVDATRSLKRLKRRKAPTSFCNAASITIWKPTPGSSGTRTISSPDPMARTNWITSRPASTR